MIVRFTDVGIEAGFALAAVVGQVSEQRVHGIVVGPVVDEAAILTAKD